MLHLKIKSSTKSQSLQIGGFSKVTVKISQHVFPSSLTQAQCSGVIGEEVASKLLQLPGDGDWEEEIMG